MSVRQRLLLIGLGVVLGGSVTLAVWAVIVRPNRCVPTLAAMQATSAVEMFKEPCTRFTWDLAEPGMPNHVVRYNNFGMHDQRVDIEKPPNTFRILVLGDSYAQGLQVPMEQGFPYLLEQQLNALETSTRFEVVNLSIDTLGTDRLLILYALFGYRLDADLVLLSTYVGNDIQNNSIELEKLRNEGYRPHAFFKLDEGGNLRLFDWDASKHALPESSEPGPAWLSRVVTQQNYTITTPNTPEIVSEQPYQLSYPVQLGLYLPEDAYWTEAWAITDAILEQFAELTAAQGSDFGVLVIPDRRAVHHADYERTIEYYPFVGQYDAAAPIERMVDIAQRHGVPALNMLPILTPVDQLNERAYLPLDGHYNAIGHQLTADALVAWLIENNLVPKS